MLPKKIAVIGIGNTLRRDDGIAILVLESLLKFYKQEGVDYLNFGIASFDLLHRLKDYDAALIIDGISANLAPGELNIFNLKDAQYNLEHSATSTHELNLKKLLQLSKEFGLKAKIYVAGIQVKDTSFGEGLSAPLNKNKEEITKKISAFIEEMVI